MKRNELIQVIANQLKHMYSSESTSDKHNREIIATLILDAVESKNLLWAAAPDMLSACEAALIAIRQAAELRNEYLIEEKQAVSKLVLALRNAYGEDHG